MPSYLTIFSAIFPVFLVVAVGFLFQRRGWVTEETETSMIRMVMNLLFPCLILSLVPGNPALEKLSTAMWAIGLGIGLTVCGFLIAWLAGLISGMRKGAGLRTFAFSSGIQNYGFIPLPILLELFPDNPGPSGLVFIFGVGVEIAIWTVGLAILTGRIGLRSIINGPFIAVVLSLSLNYSGTHPYVPDVILTSMKMLGNCAVPISIFLIGATIGRCFREGIFNEALRVGVSSVLVRLVGHSALILAAAYFLPISEDLRVLLVVQAAMPAATFPVILARLYEGQPHVATQVVLITSMVGLISAPFVIAWGLGWLAHFGWLVY